MSVLDTEIATFNRLRDDLEVEHSREWVVIRDSQLVGTFLSFEEAAKSAIKKFGKGPYLIRQVGAPQLALQTTVVAHCRPNASR